VAGGTVGLVDLVKEFTGHVAVRGINLEIAGGEFFSLLGPSGCGKTTTLRLVAGFEQPTSGKILIDGVDQVTTPPHKRPVNTVFQSYALFPFMTVAQNVAFGLKLRKTDKGEVDRRVGEALELVRMGHLSGRKPGQLSGGQQQRVALARALVLKPSVLLLDEPLGALDAKLRKELQIELKALQEEIGVTFIYVTHDQEEALTMSDRLAVMSEGNVEQVGSPTEVYESPVSTYVADFLGTANVLDVDVTATGSATTMTLGPATLTSTASTGAPLGAGRAVIRPERLGISGSGTTGENMLPAIVDRTVYVGSITQVIARLASGQTLNIMLPNTEGATSAHAHGDAVSVHVPPDAIRVLPDFASHAGKVDA
jgi:spermidine/putrescine transport system ATP-binding protein